MRSFTDDLGAEVLLPEVGPVPMTVVSLVPSLTEAVACSLPGSLLAATDWCTHPGDLDVPRIGGTKNPDVEAIVAMAPDVVVANEEENKPEHVAALRGCGIAVWVTDIRDVDGAIGSIERLLDALGAPQRGWLEEAREGWSARSAQAPVRRRRALVPIWRRPWMCLGPDTYAADVLRRLGYEVVAPDAEPGDRYPRFAPEDVTRLRPEVVVLPDEPYAFTADDGPDAFDGIPVAFVPGRLLTWYGPAMVEALHHLPSMLGHPG